MPSTAQKNNYAKDAAARQKQAKEAVLNTVPYNILEQDKEDVLGGITDDPLFVSTPKASETQITIKVQEAQAKTLINFQTGEKHSVSFNESESQSTPSVELADMDHSPGTSSIPDTFIKSYEQQQPFTQEIASDFKPFWASEGNVPLPFPQEQIVQTVATEAVSNSVSATVETAKKTISVAGESVGYVGDLAFREIFGIGGAGENEEPKTEEQIKEENNISHQARALEKQAQALQVVGIQRKESKFKTIKRWIGGFFGLKPPIEAAQIVADAQTVEDIDLNKAEETLDQAVAQVTETTGSGIGFNIGGNQTENSSTLPGVSMKLNTTGEQVGQSVQTLVG
jgi:hypothetical protein